MKLGPEGNGIALKIAFVADPPAGVNPKGNTTYAMMREASARGHELHAFSHADLSISGEAVLATASRVVLSADVGAWFHVEEIARRPLSDFDVVVERTDPPFSLEYIYATYLLELAETQGARVVNRPAAIRNHNEKLAITGFPQFTAETLVTRSAVDVRLFHTRHRDIILKPLDRMGGSGVFRVGEDGLNLDSIVESLTDNGKQTIMVQRHIPEIVKGDKRVLLIGGQVVPLCIARLPPPGEVRANIAAGATAVVVPLSAAENHIAQTLAPILLDRGLYLVGLDVIGDYLTEINVTSPGFFPEIMKRNGFNIAGMCIDMLEDLA